MTLQKFYKQKLKELAFKLKTAKPLSRTLQSLKDKKASNEDIQLIISKLNEVQIHNISDARDEARYLHIIYCLMRGRTIEQIERNPRQAHDESKRLKIEERMNKWFELKKGETNEN